MLFLYDELVTILVATILKLLLLGAIVWSYSAPVVKFFAITCLIHEGISVFVDTVIFLG